MTIGLCLGNSAAASANDRQKASWIAVTSRTRTDVADQLRDVFTHFDEADEFVALVSPGQNGTQRQRAQHTKLEPIGLAASSMVARSMTSPLRSGSWTRSSITRSARVK